VGRDLEVAADDRRMRPAKSEVSRLHADSSKAVSYTHLATEAKMASTISNGVR